MTFYKIDVMRAGTNTSTRYIISIYKAMNLVKDFIIAGYTVKIEVLQMNDNIEPFSKGE